jgi:hypothetical protein
MKKYRVRAFVIESNAQITYIVEGRQRGLFFTWEWLPATSFGTHEAAEEHIVKIHDALAVAGSYNLIQKYKKQ